jgi:hypothetical protein
VAKSLFRTLVTLSGVAVQKNEWHCLDRGTALQAVIDARLRRLGFARAFRARASWAASRSITRSRRRSRWPGFQPDHVLLASVDPGANHYSEAQSRALFANLLERAETVPGVRAASAALVSPLSGSLWLYSVAVPGYRPAAHETPVAYFNAVGPGYFSSIGSALIRGREFTPRDRAGAPPVAVFNDAMAKKFWPGRDPVGGRFSIGDRPVEVVGVVRDSIYRVLREPKQVVVYVPLLQGDFRTATLDLRVAGDPSRVFNDLRAVARQIDGDVPLFDMRTLQAQIAGTLSPERMLAVISALFSLLATLLAAVGLYGVLAYAVGTTLPRDRNSHGAGGGAKSSDRRGDSRCSADARRRSRVGHSSFPWRLRGGSRRLSTAYSPATR